MAASPITKPNGSALSELLAMVLPAAGYEVEATPSGLSALLLFSERPFDLVLLDMQIEDLSGPGAHRAIRDTAPLPPS